MLYVFLGGKADRIKKSVDHILFTYKPCPEFSSRQVFDEYGEGRLTKEKGGKGEKKYKNSLCGGEEGKVERGGERVGKIEMKEMSAAM